MKRFTTIAVICLIALTSCIQLDTPRPRSFSRTVLLYLACDGNSLQWYAETDLANLVNGYLPVRTNRDEALLVFLDEGKEQPTLHRYYSTSGGNVYKELVKLYDTGFDSADPDNLKKVLDDVESFYPSERRGLVLWSHGTGWLPPGYYSNPRESKSVSVKSFALEKSSEIDIRDLADVLTRHYEFILFDSCLMSTVEVAYQLRNKTDYIIASCAEVLVDGFPYTEIAQDFFFDHSGKGNAALKDICEQYYKYYDAKIGPSRTATVSLIDCSRLEELAAVCKSIYSAHKDDMAAVNRNEVQRYFTSDKHWFYDLEDYIRHFASRSECLALSNALERCVPCKYNTPWVLDAFQVNCHSGFSTYIPIQDAGYLNSYYKTLDWTKDTGAL